MLFIPIRIRTSAPNLGIAQVVEHLIWDQEVVGAGPTTETKILGRGLTVTYPDSHCNAPA